MAGGDGRLQLIRSGVLDGARALESGEAARDPSRIPARALLIGQQDELARGVGARGRARGLQLHQREQPEDLGFVGHQLGEHLAETDRLLAQIVTHERCRRRAPRSPR